MVNENYQDKVIELAKPAYRDGKFISAEQVSPIYLRNNVVNQENR